MKNKESIKSIAVLVLIFITYSIGITQVPFITTWQTDNPGSSCNSCITIGTQSGSTYNYEVDWDNNGTYDDTGLTGDITHDFGVAGTYTIAIRGDFPRTNFIDDREKLVGIDRWGDIVWTSMASAFGGCVNMNITAPDAPILSSVSSMAGMFSGCTSLNASLDTWDVTTVTDMSSMFASASSFNGRIGQWNVRNVTDMSYMFSHTIEFNQDIGRWDFSSLFNSSAMFLNASSFNQDLSEWNVENIEHMGAMFVDASSFDQDLGNWTFNHNVTFSLWGNIGFLEGAGLSCENFSNSLLGWASNPNTPTNIEMGSMINLEHAEGPAALAKEYLFTSLNWFFSGDIIGVCNVECLSSSPVRIEGIVASPPNNNTTTLTISFIDGARPVQLTWDNESVTTTDDQVVIPNLENGTYLFTVVDEQFCIDTMSFIIEEAGVPDIVITEIMYNPPESGADSLEFIKLTNIGSTPVNLEGIQFIDAITFTFPEIVLDEDESIHIFEDTIAAKLVYGFQENILQFEGSLRNGGEILELTSIDGFLIDSVRYANQSPWPLEAAGQGYSLVLCDYSSNNSLAENWSLSTSNSCQIINNSELFYNSLDGLSCDTCYSSCNSDFPIVIGGQCTTINGEVGVMQDDCQCIQLDGCEEGGLLATACSSTDPNHVDYNPFFPICDFNFLDGLTETMCTIVTGNGPNPLCSGGAAHNIGWFSFIAGDGDYSFSITPSDCTDAGTGPGPGMDAGIYTDCSFSQVIDCYSCSTAPISFPNRDSNGDFILLPGEIYYVYIDGCAGSVCEYTIDVIGDFIPFEPGCPTGVECEGGLDQDCGNFVCPGTAVLFNLIDLDDEQVLYNWSISQPFGWEVVSMMPDPANPLQSSVNSIELIFTVPGEFTFCWDEIISKCYTSSRQGICNNDPELCKTIFVEFVEDEDFGTVVLCEADLFSYNGPQVDLNGNPDPNHDGFQGWQTPVNPWAEGIYEFLITNPEGCEYVETVEIEVDYAPDPVEGQWNLIPCGEAEYTIEIEDGDMPFWSWPGDVVDVSGQGNDTLVVDWTGSAGGMLSVLVTDQCGGSGGISQTILPINEPIIEIICISSTTNSVTFQWTDVPGVDYEIEIVQGPPSNIGGPQSDNTFTMMDMGIGEGAIINVTTESDFCDSYTITSSECFAQDCPPVIITLLADPNTLCFEPLLAPIDISVDVDVTDLMGTGTFSVVGGGPGIADANVGQFDPTAAGIGAHTIQYDYTGSGPIYENCAYSATMTFVIYETPTSDFIIDRDNICVDEIFTITYTGNTNNGSFNWIVSPDELMPGLDGLGPFEASWPTPGSKDISLTVERDGCISEPTSLSVIVDDLISPITVTCGPSTPTSVTFDWNDVNNISGYDIITSINGGSNSSTSTQSVNTYTIDGLNQGDEVTITVIAVSNNSCSDQSNTASCIVASEPNSCESAIEMCDKSIYSANFLGNDIRMDNVACGLLFDPYWLTWTIRERGDLSFIIYPEIEDSDIDFILYKSTDGSCSPSSLEAVRCVMSGSSFGNSGIESICIAQNGAIGLSPQEVDFTEPAGCSWGQNGFVDDLDCEIGDVYFLVISNFITTKPSFQIEWCGSALLDCDEEICEDYCIAPSIVNYLPIDTVACDIEQLNLGGYSYGSSSFSTLDNEQLGFESISTLYTRYTINEQDRARGYIDFVLTSEDVNNCNISLSDTLRIFIVGCDCNFSLEDDYLSLKPREEVTFDLIENDLIDYDEFKVDVVSISDEDLSTNYTIENGALTITIFDDFADTIKMTYEVCTQECTECSQAILYINNGLIEDIVQTNFIDLKTPGFEELRFNSESVIEGSELWVYNRWGDQIFHAENYTNDWIPNGYPGGIYYYVLKVNGVSIKKTLTINK